MVLSQTPMEGTVTCYGVKVIDTTTVEVDHTKMFEASQVDTSFFGREIVELCAGAGAMGHAIEQMGGKVAVAIDHNSLAYEHLRANHEDGVIHGDIRKTEVIEKAHRFLSENGIEHFSVTAGFPCQPFSTQGLQLGNQDGRFDTFRGLLVAVMLLAPQAVLLECVPGASRDPEVQAGLDWLMQKLGWEKREYGTDLSWFWPMRRNRWFCVLAPPAWIQNMCYKIEGSITELRVGDVLTEFVHDHEADLSQLQLSEYELSCYQDKRLGSDKRQLEASDICATALHSYASPLSECPCGCRSHSFAEASLVLHGLRGFYVIASKHDKPRYLTTQEMATLLTVGDTMQFSTNEKANLCLLGQIAAPAQVIRVYGELMHSAAHYAVNLNKVNAELLLQQYLKKIQAQHGKPRNPHTVETVPTVILEPNEPAITFTAHIGTQTQQILKAERINKTWGIATTLQSNEQTLPDEFSIHALNEPPQIQRVTKKSRSTLELLRIVVLLKHKGNAIPVIGHAGDFLFQFLPDPSITQESWILTRNGDRILPDTRIWHADIFTITDDSDFPKLPQIQDFRGNGTAMMAGQTLPTMDAKGLSDLDLHQQIETFIHTSKAHVDIWLPRTYYYLIDTRASNAIQHIQEIWPQSNHVIGILWESYHWITFEASKVESHMQVSFWNGLDWHVTATMDHRLMLATGATSLHISQQHKIKQTHPRNCGTIALLHIKYLLGLNDDFTEENATRWYEELKANQSASLSSSVYTPDISDTIPYSLTGSGPDNKSKLAQLLHEKGVPFTLADQRAEQAIGRIGHTEITRILQDKNPWAALKAAANKPGVNMRLINDNEKAAYIEQRASTKHGAQIKDPKKKKQPKHKQREEISLNPECLTIDPKHFKDGSGKPIPQIHFREVGADQRGLAICSTDTAAQFLQQPKSISTKALGLLLLEMPQSATSTTHQDEIPSNIHKHRRTDSCVWSTSLTW